MRYKVAAAALLIVGLLQMAGDLLRLPALRGVGAATTASPAPKVFSAVRGLETYSTRFFIEWQDRDGASHALMLTPEVNARLRGPYNRRNVYGAVLAYGPVLATDPRTRPMFTSVARHALCGDAPLLRELGIDPDTVEPGSLRVRLEPLPGADLGDLPRVLEGAMPVSNGWTGGQYSLFRVLFGIYLLVHFVHLVPWGAELFSNQGVLPQASESPLIHLFPNVLALWDGPVFVTGLLVAAAGLSVLLALGWHDRAAAVALWYVWACLFGRNPLIANPGLPFVGWILLAHACLPSAPYGSWAARGRPDPGGGWHFPQPIFVAAWVVMALGYSYSGYTKLVSPSWLDGTAMARILENPLARPGPLREALLALPAWLLHLGTWGALALELLFAPLALLRVLRPWLWGLMLLMHLALLVLIDFADLSLGLVLLHLFTFDPAWVRPLPAPAERLFYDGRCGLCHGAVRFVLAEDRTGDAFRLAPLDSDAFRAAVPEAERAGLPDTVVVSTAEGRLLVRSEAVLHMLRRLGGVWRLLGEVGRFLPLGLRDRLYDAIAGSRHRLFRRPTQACPLLPTHLRVRFDL